MVSSGREILGMLDDALQQARAQIQRFETEAERYSEQLVQLRQRESEIYRELARLRIDELQLARFHDALDQAERQAASLLEERNQAIAELAVRTVESEKEQTDLEQRRQQQAESLEQATTALENRLEEIHAELKNDPDYQTQQQKAQQAIDILSAADEKTAEAEQDREEKGKPFREDQLFMYLWNRRYGTSEYRANLLARFFDRLLAKHIRYEASRQNYHRLLEIPTRLREHTEKLRDTAEQEMKRLATLEREAEKAAGIETLEQAVEKEKERLAELDQAIEEAVRKYQALLAEHEKFTAGEDPLFQQAIKLLVNAFRGDPIPELRRDAARTEGYEDDGLVSELAELRHRKNALQEMIDEYGAIHQQQKIRLQELADIRHRFKTYDYDAANSRFNEADAIAELLQQFRNGQISAGRLWRAIERAQRFIRYARQPTIGSIGFPTGIRLPGGLGIPRSGGLRIPRGIRFPGGLGGIGRGGGVRFPGSGGGGGFRTGGGF